MSRFSAMLLGMLLVPGCSGHRAPRPTLDSLPADTPRMAMRTLAAPLPSTKADTSRSADTTRWQDTTKLGDTAIQFSRGRVFRLDSTIKKVRTTVSLDSTWIVRTGYAVIGGIPFGLFAMWDSTTPKPNTQAFSMFYGNTTPWTILGQLSAAKQKQMRLVTSMTGGARANYLSMTGTDTLIDTVKVGPNWRVDTTYTGGVLAFDMAKWRKRMDLYDTPAIKAAVNQGIADGWIIANNVIDEPFNVGNPGNEANGWGPAGTLTKARVDSMCAYQKQIFPTLPTGVFHDYKDFDRSHTYKVCDHITAQWRHAKGSLTAFRDSTLAMGRREGIAVSFAINVLDGGIQASRRRPDGTLKTTWDPTDCPLTTTGGRGSYFPNCRMTPAQIRQSGILLGKAGCYLTGYRFDAQMVADTAFRNAYRSVSDSLIRSPAISCRRAP